MKRFLCSAAVLAALCMNACGNESVTTPDSLPVILTETTAEVTTTATRYFDSPTTSPDETGTALTLTDASGNIVSLTTVTGTGTSLTATTSTAQNTSSTLSTITTLTTTSLTTTTTTAPLQVFNPIAGDWYINGDPAQGRVIISAAGVFTAYDGKNKVTAVGQAKHEVVTKGSGTGTAEVRYNLYNKFGNNIVLSIIDTGAAVFTELYSEIDGSTVYYAHEGKGFVAPNEAARKQIAQKALETITTLEALSCGAVELDEDATMPGNELYAKVKKAPVKSAAEIRTLLDTNLSGAAKAKYAGLISGNLPTFVDANGQLYALAVNEATDYKWIANTLKLGNYDDHLFMASAQYNSSDGTKKTAQLTFRYEDENWKIVSIES